MIDIKLIRQDRKGVEERLRTKEPDVDLTSICAMDDEIRALKTHTEQLKAKRNEASKQQKNAQMPSNGHGPSLLVLFLLPFRFQIAS